MSDEFIPAARACELLGISPATLYAYVSRGLVQSRPGADHRSRVYRRSDVDKLLQRKRIGRGAARGGAHSKCGPPHKGEVVFTPDHPHSSHRV